jgi:hypothetical protein
MSNTISDLIPTKESWDVDLPQLPDLSGSEKQKLWANSIRFERISELQSELKTLRKEVELAETFAEADRLKKVSRRDKPWISSTK